LALPFFAVTLFVSAFLLFLVQPLISKLILPRLGGAPQVWNTCVVFFQLALLAGYAYSHSVSTYLKTRRQLLVHSLLLFVPLLILLPNGPFNISSWVPPPGANPIPSTLLLLTAVVGVPFIVVATSAPLLQRWFAHTGHPAARDPYFLYGASNLGSMLALLAYPTIIEPNLGLSAQTWVWTGAYVLMSLLIAGCAFLVWKSPPIPALEADGHAALSPSAAATAVKEGNPPATTKPTTTAVKAGPAPAAKKVTAIKKGPGKRKGRPLASAPIAPRPAAVPAPAPKPFRMTWWKRLRWVLLAAVPCSLMLGVTTYMSTDISAITFFWIIPLALYLLTFILVFMRSPINWTEGPHRLMLILQPILMTIFLVEFLRSNWGGVGSVIGSATLNLSVFFVTALVCHGELARDRPPTKYLTEFYLWLSVGGAVGGMFNGLIAPLLFNGHVIPGVFGVVEYPLAFAVACLMRPNMRPDGWIDEWVMRTMPDVKSSFENLYESFAKMFGRTPEGKSHILLNLLFDVTLALLVGAFANWLIWNALSRDAWNWESIVRVDSQGREAFNTSNPLVRFWKSFITNPESLYSWVTFSLKWVVYGLPLLIALVFAYGRGLRYGLAVGLIMLAATNYSRSNERRELVFADRSYFGILRVSEDSNSSGRYHLLMHGTTTHGLQCQESNDKTNPNSRRRESLTYYHRRCPVGQVMDGLTWWPKVSDTPFSPSWASDARMPVSLIGMGAANVFGGSGLPLEQLVDCWSEPPYATIGLGTGTMASYGRPFQHVHYYEIDDHVRAMSLPPDGSEPLFSYIQDAQKRGSEVRILMGDARLKMSTPYEEGGGPDGFYHAIIVDAFSSDAIPTHLITQQAIKMYMQKLAPGGILCVHTSNRHVDLVPVVADVAHSLGLACKLGHWPPQGKHGVEDTAVHGMGYYSSEWVMVARTADDLKRLDSSTWHPARRGNRPPWTDDYSNLLSVFRWR
jgi:hypothetical protein